MSQDQYNDISLKELIIRIRDYSQTLFRSWFKIGLVGLLMAVVLLLLNLGKPPKYEARLTFMLNEDTAGSLSSLSGILGQFGIGSARSESNLDKIMELSKARKISQNALFEKIKLNGAQDYLANLLIANLESDKKWDKKNFLLSLLSSDSVSLKGFRFTQDSLELFNLLENKALKRLHQKLAGTEKTSGLFSSEYSELTSIMSLSMASSNEDLSVATVNQMFEELSSYYVEKSTEKQEYEYNLIKTKYDSINDRLAGVQYSLAEFQDSYRDLYKKQDILQEKRLKTEEQKLLIMSGEAEKQLQIAALALDNKTPYIQVIDKPLKPIKPSNKSAIYFFLLGGILGCFLAALYILLQKVYKDIMNGN